MQKVGKIIGIIWYTAVAGLLALSLALFSLKPHFNETLIAGGILLLFLLMKRHSRSIGMSGRYMEARIWLLAFVTRYSYCCFMNDKIVQCNDFATTLEEARTGNFIDRLDYYRQWAHKLLYPLLLHQSGLTSQSRIYLFQCIILAFTSVLVYRIAVKVTRKNSDGFPAALLYIVWPGQLLYASLISEEHVAAFLTCGIVLILITAYQLLEQLDFCRKNIAKYFAMTGLAGILTGLVAFFKDWGAVILTAMVISGIWILMHLHGREARILFLSGLVIIFVLRVVLTGGILQMCRNRLGGVSIGNNVVISQMYTALDPDSSGMYDEKRNTEYLEIVQKNNYDFRAANREALELLTERIRRNPEKMPKLLYEKGTTAYVDDASQLYWSLVAGRTSEEDYNSYRGLIQILWYAAAVYYVLMVLCLIAGMVRKPSPEKFFIGLVILGGICVSLIIESHGRYKYSIEPLWCVLCCTAFEPGVGGFLKSDRLKSFIHQRGRGSAAG